MSRLSAGAVLLDLFGPPRPSALLGAAIVTGAGLIWGLITLSSGAEILASFAGARDANPNDPLERQFINVVAEMAIAAGVEAPRAMVMETPALNAFASGSSPKHAMITATTGILQACTREELQAVIGHEMGHVAEYDVRYTTVVAAMAGVIVLLAHFLGNIAQYSFGWGGYGYGGYGYRQSRSREEGGAGGTRLALTLVVVAVLVVLLIVAPLASKLVQMAISRQREYLADASSAKLTRNPDRPHPCAAAARSRRHQCRAVEFARLGALHRGAERRVVQRSVLDPSADPRSHRAAAQSRRRCGDRNRTVRRTSTAPTATRHARDRATSARSVGCGSAAAAKRALGLSRHWTFAAACSIMRPIVSQCRDGDIGDMRTAVIVGNPKAKSRTLEAGVLVAQKLTGAEPDLDARPDRDGPGAARIRQCQGQ